MRTTRKIWWAVMGMMMILMVLAASANAQSIGGPLLLAMIAWWFVGGFFSRIIGTMIISSIRCKGCGLEIPAFDRWQIGSYTDHQTRHILAAKNPLDGSRVGHINCPQCQATVLV